MNMKSETDCCLDSEGNKTCIGGLEFKKKQLLGEIDDLEKQIILICTDKSSQVESDNEYVDHMYHAAINNVIKSHNLIKKLNDDTEIKTNELQGEIKAKQDNFDNTLKAYRAYQRDVASKAKFSGSTKLFDMTILDEFERDEELKQNEIKKLWLSILKMKQKEKIFLTKVEEKNSVDEIDFNHLQRDYDDCCKKKENRIIEINELIKKKKTNEESICKLSATLENKRKQLQTLSPLVDEANDMIVKKEKRLQSLLRRKEELLNRISKVQSTKLNTTVLENYEKSKEEEVRLSEYLKKLKEKHASLS